MVCIQVVDEAFTDVDGASLRIVTEHKLIDVMRLHLICLPVGHSHAGNSWTTVANVTSQ